MFIKINPYGIIYLLRNVITDKVYIGQTVDLNRRINEHKNRKSSSSKKYNFHITKIINKFGYENFQLEVLGSAFSKKELDEKEKYYIIKYKSNNPAYGYNSRSGNLKEPLNQHTRKLMSKSHVGLKESAETKRKKSNKIVAFKNNKFFIIDSAKLFGDMIGMRKDKVKNALRMPCKIKGYYVFYLNDEKRKDILKRSKNIIYCELSKLIEKGVEAIEKLYEIEYISYNE